MQKTPNFGFSEEKILDEIGTGHEFKREDHVAIKVNGEKLEASILVFELLACSDPNHWHGSVHIPEGATTETTLFAEVKVSPPLLKVINRELAKHELL